MDDDEPTTEELRIRVDQYEGDDERRAQKADYLRKKLDEREQAEREAERRDED